MNVEMTDLDMTLDCLETTSLESHDDYTSEFTYKDQKILYKYIKELQQENQQLKEQLKDIDFWNKEYNEVFNKNKILKHNWNELKRWLYEDHHLYIDVIRENSTYTEMFKKMFELERGESDVKNYKD